VDVGDIAVNGTRRNKDQISDDGQVGFRHAIHESFNTRYICCVMRNRVFPAGRFSDDPGQVDDGFYALEGVAKHSDVSNVTIKDFDLFFYFLEWLSTPQKAIKNAHFVAASEQLLDYARADVARTPGHKHAHDITSLAAARQHPVGPRTPGASILLISMLRSTGPSCGSQRVTVWRHHSPGCALLSPDRLRCVTTSSTEHR
jgi:hypothetical protein